MTTIKKLKELDKRTKELEDWIEDVKDTHSQPMILDNYNFLLTTVRQYVDGMAQMRTEMGRMQQMMQENGELMNGFIETHDMKARWEAFIEKKNEEKQKEIDVADGEETSTEDEPEILTTDGQDRENPKGLY